MRLDGACKSSQTRCLLFDTPDEGDRIKTSRCESKFLCSVAASGFLSRNKRTESDIPKEDSIKVYLLCQKMATKYSIIALWPVDSVVQSSRRDRDFNAILIHTVSLIR
jgi:hypothetical protein